MQRDLVEHLKLADTPSERLVHRALMLTINERVMEAEAFDQWAERHHLSPKEVRMLKRIAHDWRIVQSAALLPADIRTLHALTRVGTYLFDEAIAVGLIRPGMTLQEAKLLAAVDLN
jgi:hypothetical protein